MFSCGQDNGSGSIVALSVACMEKRGGALACLTENSKSGMMIRAYFSVGETRQQEGLTFSHRKGEVRGSFLLWSEKVVAPS